MDNNKFPQRKVNRLKDWDYSEKGCYFITICVKDRKCILSTICVGCGVLDAPVVELTKYGHIVDEQIKTMNEIYKNINVQHYVIMPNHIHLLIRIRDDGRSGTPAPTKGNAVVARFVSTFKRFCNKEYGDNIWQRGYYDHVIRDQRDYDDIYRYIENNPTQWELDELYTP